MKGKQRRKALFSEISSDSEQMLRFVAVNQRLIQSVDVSKLSIGQTFPVLFKIDNRLLRTFSDAVNLGGCGFHAAGDVPRRCGFSYIFNSDVQLVHLVAEGIAVVANGTVRQL